MSVKPLRIIITAAEPSGDLLASSVIRAVKKINPNAEFEGIAGPNMVAAGCKALYDMDELSVMLITETFKKLPKILRIRRALKAYCLKNPPDLFLGFDAAAFNLKLEMQLRKAGIPTVHYNSPKIWAWNAGRIKKIEKACSLMLTLFPFEAPLYEAKRIPARYIGHPMADEIPEQTDKSAAKAALGLAADDKIIAILPGSRTQEIEALSRVFLDAARYLLEYDSSYRFVVPMINEKKRALFNKLAREYAPDLPLRIIQGRSRETMAASDAVLLASGTATLEALLLQKPMVVAYKVSALSYRILRPLVKCRYMALPNLLADKKLVPELLQQDANPENIAEQVITQLRTNPTDLIQAYREIADSLRCNSSEQAAKAILQTIN